MSSVGSEFNPKIRTICWCVIKNRRCVVKIIIQSDEIPFVVALTKCDKLNKTERMNMLQEICGVLTNYGEISVVPFSATKGDGVDELRNLIEKYLR